MSAQWLAFALTAHKVFGQAIGNGTVLRGQIDAAENEYAAYGLCGEKAFIKKQYAADDADQRHDIHKHGSLTGPDDTGAFVPEDHGDQPAGKNDEQI